MLTLLCCSFACTTCVQNVDLELNDVLVDYVFLITNIVLMSVFDNLNCFTIILGFYIGKVYSLKYYAIFQFPFPARAQYSL